MHERCRRPGPTRSSLSPRPDGAPFAEIDGARVRHILAVGIPSTRREDFIAMQPLHAPHGTPNTILVCGEALMDVLVDADGCQHPVPGGGPFNTARALAGLGVQAAFLGRLSTDAYGQQLADALLAAGASLDWASRGPEPT